MTDRLRFRVGRKLGRTLYLAGIDPDHDPVVGMMDTPELAQYIVDGLAERDRMAELLRGLVEAETDPCTYDHHGYCQAHGWFGEPGECYTREARELLGL